MTHHADGTGDRELRERLRAMVDRPTFPAQRLTLRIAESVERLGAVTPDERTRIRRPFAWRRWRTRLAAAALVFAAGLWTGRALAPAGRVVAERGPVSDATPGGVRRIDLTRPRETPLGVDGSLGLVLRCVTCQPVTANGRVRWRTNQPPVVDSVTPGGVADEAGLRAGDVLLDVAGTDIRDEAGLQNLLAYPLRDFALTWQRGSDTLQGVLNLRFTSRRVIHLDPEVVVTDGDKGVGATLGRWWRTLTGR